MNGEYKMVRLIAVALLSVGIVVLCIGLVEIASLFNDHAEAERIAREIGINELVGVSPLDAVPFFIVIAGFGCVLMALGIILWFVEGKKNRETNE